MTPAKRVEKADDTSTRLASDGRDRAPAANQDGAAVQAPKIRVLIVDDHALVRAGFIYLLASTPDLRCVGEAGTAAAALEEAARLAPDVIMLDISLPDAGGLECVSTLRRRHPGVPILIISLHSEAQYAVNLLRAGANGFFSKTGEARDMLEAIRTVAAGQKYITPTLAAALAESDHQPRAPHHLLSAREFEIFVQLAAGKTVGDIGIALRLSSKTVSTYRTRILEKMGMARNAEITAYALRNNLMSEQSWTP